METVATLPDRVAVIGDVHAEDALLNSALEYCSAEGVRAVLCTGDVVDGYGSAQRCCELLEKHGVLTVRGNHDRWLGEGTFRDFTDATCARELNAKAREFLDTLPRTREFSTALGPLLLCHGLGRNDMAKVRDDDFGYALESNQDLQSLLRSAQYQLVVNGHSHHAMVRSFSAVTIVNAGTLKRDNDPCFLLIDLAAARVEHFLFLNGQLVTKAHRTFALSRNRGDDPARRRLTPV